MTQQISTWPTGGSHASSKVSASVDGGQSGDVPTSRIGAPVAVVAAG